MYLPIILNFSRRETNPLSIDWIGKLHLVIPFYAFRERNKFSVNKTLKDSAWQSFTYLKTFKNVALRYYFHLIHFRNEIYENFLNEQSLYIYIYILHAKRRVYPTAIQRETSQTFVSPSQFNISTRSLLCSIVPRGWRAVTVIITRIIARFSKDSFVPYESVLEASSSRALNEREKARFSPFEIYKLVCERKRKKVEFHSFDDWSNSFLFLRPIPNICPNVQRETFMELIVKTLANVHVLRGEQCVSTVPLLGSLVRSSSDSPVRKIYLYTRGGSFHYRPRCEN